MTNANTVKKALHAYASKERAKVNVWFFKTGKGQYGEGDEFIGVTVPDTRKVAREHKDIPFKEIEVLLQSKKHEHRLAALLILVERFREGDEKKQKQVYRFYLSKLDRVNNWDLVDLSAHEVVGTYVRKSGDVSKLVTLARSNTLWRRRVAIVSTYAFIKAGDLHVPCEISELLLADTEDLIHKAVGWMLREVGKKDISILRSFLSKHSASMHRTTLRYAIERMSKEEKSVWMKKDKK